MSKIKPGDKVLVKSIGRVATVEQCDCREVPLALKTLLVYEESLNSPTGFRYWHVSEEGVIPLPESATPAQIEALRSICA